MTSSGAARRLALLPPPVAAREPRVGRHDRVRPLPAGLRAGGWVALGESWPLTGTALSRRPRRHPGPGGEPGLSGQDGRRSHRLGGLEQLPGKRRRRGQAGHALSGQPFNSGRAGWAGPAPGESSDAAPLASLPLRTRAGDRLPTTTNFFHHCEQ